MQISRLDSQISKLETRIVKVEKEKADFVEKYKSECQIRLEEQSEATNERVELV